MELAIVIPVFNEDKTIKLLIRNLYDLVVKENISCRFIIINDGSTDNTLSILQDLSIYIPDVKILSYKNSGHGPSLLRGYHLSLDYEWVFQIDSDYDYSISAFTLLWKNRKAYDLLVAERQKRNASFLRNVATLLTQYLVMLLYGRGLKDINSPFRLIRTKKLALALSYINNNSFAPNVLVTAFFLKRSFPFYSTTAQFNIKPYNRRSKMSFYIFKGCIKTFTDLLFFRFKI